MKKSGTESILLQNPPASTLSSCRWFSRRQIHQYMPFVFTKGIGLLIPITRSQRVDGASPLHQ